MKYYHARVITTIKNTCLYNRSETDFKSAFANALFLIQKNRAYPIAVSSVGADGRDRTDTGIASHGILSPGRLPVPPHRHLPAGILPIVNIIAYANRFVNNFKRNFFAENVNFHVENSFPTY